MLGHHRPATERQFQWRFAGGQRIASLKWYLDPTKKNIVRVGPPLTKLSGSVHDPDRLASSEAI